MAAYPSVSKLPETERRQALEQYLILVNQHPSLTFVRSFIPAGPERQIALFAALERAVLVGSPLVAPPKHDDLADQVLCDILDAIATDPVLKNRGSYYGADQHRINLQALGVWKGDQPLSQPTATELFATAFSHLTACPTNTLPSPQQNSSPASQVFGQNGDLISPAEGSKPSALHAAASPQPADTVLVVTISPHSSEAAAPLPAEGLIRHQPEMPGEQLSAPPSDGCHVPVRPVRRGRPIALDDVAKGKLLGLMSFGLSFRQAAARLGVHHQTLLNALKRDEEFAQQVAEARLDAISQPLLTVIQASRTSWRAAAWLTKFLDDRRARTYESTPEEIQLQKLRPS